MKGKLRDYALMAEIVGAAGVIISLVYVGIGVRQNTDAVRVANHQALGNGAMDDNIWNGWDAFYKSQLATEPFRWFWRENSQTFSPEFRSYVDSQ